MTSFFLVTRVRGGRCHGVPPGPDDELCTRLRAGDAAAFDEVYRRQRPRLYAFLVRLLGRRDLADDLLQETFMRLATHAGRLRPDTEIGAWLFTVARNLTLSHRRWARLGEARHWIARQLTPAAAPTPLELATAEEEERRLEAALARLSDPYREVLLLVAVDGMEHDAAAAVVGVKADAFRQRLARARAMLKEACELGPAVRRARAAGERR